MMPTPVGQYVASAMLAALHNAGFNPGTIKDFRLPRPRRLPVDMPGCTISRGLAAARRRRIEARRWGKPGEKRMGRGRR